MDEPAAVTAAWVHGTEVAYSWHDSMFKLIMADIGTHARLIRGGNIAVRYGTGGIVSARNQVATEFLKRDVEWLWWVDTDMGFAPSVVDDLVAAADPDERPVVGALCFGNREESLDGMGGFVTLPMPTVYRWHQVSDGRGGFVPWVDYPRDRLVPAAGTGSACILIHRSVLEKIQAEEGDNWYTPLHHPEMGEVSEDLSFCMRLARHEIPLFVHTGVKTTHLKQLWVSEGAFDAQRDQAERSIAGPVDGEPMNPRKVVADGSR